jgi:hypothetical protein
MRQARLTRRTASPSCHVTLRGVGVLRRIPIERSRSPAAAPRNGGQSREKESLAVHGILAVPTSAQRVSPVHHSCAAKAALASERPSIGGAVYWQTRLNLSEPHSLAALGTSDKRDSGVGRRRRYKHVQPPPEFIAEISDPFTQFVGFPPALTTDAPFRDGLPGRVRWSNPLPSLGFRLHAHSSAQSGQKASEAPATPLARRTR